MRADFLRGIKVSVRVDGRDLQEYDIDVDGKTATCYVEATPGATFVVEVSLDRSFPFNKDHLTSQAFLDGKGVCAKVTSLSSIPTSGSSVLLDGAVESTMTSTTIRRMTFAEHQMTDVAVKKMKKQRFDQLGDIKIEVIRCRELGEEARVEQAKFKSAADKGVPEKALKGQSISAHAKLGSAQPTQYRSWVKTDFPHGTDPIGTFTFKYRTHRDLQIEGFIERTPSPVPLEDREPDSLNPEERLQLIYLMRERERDSVRIKQEVKREKRARSATLVSDDNGSDEDEVTITDEGNRRKRARSSRDPGAEVIDLS